MTSKFVIRDLFNLPGGVAVLACESVGGGGMLALKKRVGTIHNDGELRQSICVSGERSMLNQTRPTSVIAIETLEKVELSVEEAQSGAWFLSVEE
jgi:hypothetical protein